MRLKKKVFYFKQRQILFIDWALTKLGILPVIKKKIEIHTVTDVIDFYGNMQQVMQQVEGQGFWVIHKSFIVNSAFVAVYHYDSVQW